MKKHILLLIIIVSHLNFYSQKTEDIIKDYQSSGFLTTFQLTNEITCCLGNQFLFEKFEHVGILYPKNHNKYKIYNINIDLVNKNFISKINEDNVYVFSDLQHASIDGREYVKIDNHILKVKFKRKSFHLYENLFKVKTKATRDPLTNAIIRKGKWALKKDYYTNKNKLQKIKLNKSTVLNLLYNTDRSKIIKYAKKNKLSFKNIDDVVLLFQKFY